jgi:fructosamine-3-kinase
MEFWGDEQFSFFESILFLALGQPVEVIETQFLSGGDISTAAQVFSSEGVFFVKWNHGGHDSTLNIDMFEAEAEGARPAPPN